MGSNVGLAEWPSAPLFLQVFVSPSFWDKLKVFSDLQCSSSFNLGRGLLIIDLLVIIHAWYVWERFWIYRHCSLIPGGCMDLLLPSLLHCCIFGFNASNSTVSLFHSIMTLLSFTIFFTFSPLNYDIFGSA